MRCLVLATLAATMAVGPAWAVTFTVNSTLDAVDLSLNGNCNAGGNACTLRAAIQEANNTTAMDIINLPAGTFTLTIAGRNENAAATGDLDITNPVTISGQGPLSTIIDGGALDRVFDISDGPSLVTIQNLTIQNGDAGTGLTKGGGVQTLAALTMTNVVVSGNKAGAGGAGICADTAESFTLTDSTVKNNMVVSGAGVIGRGGGVVGAIDSTLTNVTVNGNSATTGAGVFSDFVMTITNSTISGNTAQTNGGGAKTNGVMDLVNVTVNGNSAANGNALTSLGNMNVRASIVAGTPSSTNCYTLMGTGMFTSLGNNIDSGNSCGFPAGSNQVNKQPGLGPLQDNNAGTTGKTFTHALLAGSPALDVIVAPCPTATDQRGTTRPFDGDGDAVAKCDVGAYEAQSVRLCGDVNGDGTRNIGDALLIAQYDVSLRPCGDASFSRPDACDVNSDGGCNIGDALRLAQCDVGLISCNFTCKTFICP